MLPLFVNRKKELEYLEQIYSKNRFSLVVLFGRRRVGKTELIKKFIENKDSAYILATDESTEENIKEFKSHFAKITKKDYFLSINESFNGLFKHLADEIKDKKTVIVIDEFPFLLNLNPGFLSTFQKIIDESLKDTKIMLILSGSSMSIMENDVLGYKSPIYGRQTNSWKVTPFQFSHVYEWISDFDKSIEAYFTFGNIPYYLSFFDKKKNIVENIKDSMLTKGMELYDEPLTLLRQEFKESRTYRHILKYISLGYRTSGKLCSATGIDKSNLTKYLSTLEETHIIKHILPLGMTRKGIYEIEDPFFKFWFRFVYANRDSLEIGRYDDILNLIRKEKDAYFGQCFERLIIELLFAYVFDELKTYKTIERWWHKDKEIDVVALNESTKEILFGECKWQNNVDAKKIIYELAQKSPFVDWHNEERIESYALFAKSFSKRISDFEGKKVFCFDLKDIENALLNCPQ